MGEKVKKNGHMGFVGQSKGFTFCFVWNRKSLEWLIQGVL